MTDKELAKEIAECSALISFDKEEISLEDAIEEIEDALEDSPYGEGWILKGKDLVYCEKEWIGSESILIFGDQESLNAEAVLWWKNSIEGDSSLISIENALDQGLTNKENKEVREEWLDGEIDSYQNSPEDALSAFQVLQDLHDQYESDIDKLDDELYFINDTWDEVKYLMKGLKKSKERPSKNSTKKGEKLVTLLFSDEGGKRQAIEIMEALAELDKSSADYQQELADLIEILDTAYKGCKKIYDEKDEELVEKKEEFKEWYRDDLPREIASTVEEYTGQNIDVNYNGDMHAFLKFEYGFDDSYILENYFEGVDSDAYAEWEVETYGADSMDAYDGQTHEDCNLFWVHY